MEAENDAVLTSKKRTLSGRKSSPSHVGNSNVVGAPARRQSSLAAFSGKVRGWLSRFSHTDSVSTMGPEIPGLTKEAERRVYETLNNVTKRRQESGQKAPRVVVITDLAKDYDDLAAMVVLRELHRLKVIKLLGFVANLNPGEKRAQFGRGALDLLDLPDMPIAIGTSGFPDRTDRKHKELDYEFDCNFMKKDDPRIISNGQDLLKELCLKAQATGEKFTLVLISSLEDIAVFCKANRVLLQDAVSNVVLQGGYSIVDGKLIPDDSAANNRYDIEAAKEFHTFIQESEISSAVYTKVAAFATPLYVDLFKDMAETKHPLGEHLRHVQVKQDLAFYQSASKDDPKERFAAFMDRKWFLTNKTSWFDDKERAAEEPYPDDKDVIPFLTKVVVYDALAALGAAGPDALVALDVLTNGNVQPHPTHRIVGFAGPPSDPGIHPENMATVLSALLKGSLLTSKCVKGLK